ncbi:hypothetical protein ACN47E_007601 [Coniothyrium glycines]
MHPLAQYNLGAVPPVGTKTPSQTRSRHPGNTALPTNHRPRLLFVFSALQPRTASNDTVQQPSRSRAHPSSSNSSNENGRLEHTLKECTSTRSLRWSHGSRAVTCPLLNCHIRVSRCFLRIRFDTAHRPSGP